MAFTKAPEYTTHQLQRIEIDVTNKVDPSRTSGNATDPTFYQCFPTIRDKELIVTKRDPINEIDHFSGTTPQGMIFDPVSNYLYLAHDENLSVYTDFSPTARTLTGSVFAGMTSDTIRFCLYRVGDILKVVAHTPTATQSVISLWDSGNSTTPDSAIPVAIENAVPSIVFLDGYLFIAKGSSIYNSDISDPAVWNVSTDFIDAEMFPDQILGLAKHHNHLVVFGKESIEFFYNAANEIGSPLSRQANYAISFGLNQSNYFDATTSFIEIGDVIYFIGGSGGSNTGIYKIENFKVTKVSDLYVDALITNNIVDFRRLGTFSHLSTPCCGLFTELGNFIYKPDTNTWSKVNPPGLKQIYSACFGNYTDEGGVYLFTYDSTNTRLSLMKSGYKSPTAENADAETFTAVYSPMNIGFANNNQKHVKWVDVLGWFPSGTVTLSYSNVFGTPSVISCGAKTQTSSANPLRWRNLGRTRGHRYTVEMAGASDVELRGLEIAYNQGTY